VAAVGGDADSAAWSNRHRLADWFRIELSVRRRLIKHGAAAGQEPTAIPNQPGKNKIFAIESSLEKKP